MEFRVLGPLEVRSGGRTLNLGGLRQRRILAALLLNPNQVVPLSRLVAAAWDDDRPATVDQQARNRVAALRRVLTKAGGLIDTEDFGYRLRVGPDELDLASFEKLADRGLAGADAGMLRQALALWRGPALVGLGGQALTRDAARLEEQRLAVWEECLELELAAGAQARVVDELAALVGAHPLRERLVGLWMTALHRSGRRAEALDAYAALADRLAEELGLDPSPDPRRRYDLIRRGDDSPPAPVPAQLPHDVAGFTGRRDDLAALDALLADGRPGQTVVISAIAGTAGVGKTALAVHWAHQARDKFPDGQLYVNLRGFDPSGAVKSPADAVRGFLDALQVPPQRIPTDPDRMAALYRDLLADKRMLVVLDNARDADQVLPLLPDAPGCMVLVTSRSRLAGLAADGHLITLDVLTDDEARQLLAHRLGAHRVAAERWAVDEIVAGCARLPLALAIVAARAASEEQSSLAALASQLNQVRGDLSAFASDDPRSDVRAVFSWSYRALSAGAARLFRLLGLHPGPDLAAPAAASLTGNGPQQVVPLLDELVRTHLLVEHSPGRYTFHDLLRVYASEKVQERENDGERRAALHRMLDHYLHSAYLAGLLFAPRHHPITLTSPQPGTSPAEIADARQALAWLIAEYPVLQAAVARAASAGFDKHTWQIPWTLVSFLDRRGLWHDAIAMYTVALAAVGRLADREAQARLHYAAGGAHIRLERYADALLNLQKALDFYRELDDDGGQANVHLSFALVYERRDDYEQVSSHAQQALDLYRTAGHEVGQARALNAISLNLIRTGDHRRALAAGRQAVSALEKLGDWQGLAATLDTIGYAHHRLGEYGEAVASYQRSLEVSRRFGARYQEAETLVNLGDTHQATGRQGDALASWRQGLAILDGLGHPGADAVRARLAGSVDR